MNIRKIFLIVACLLSGVALFLPLYSLQLNGETVEGGTATLMPSVYGIIIIIADLVVIGSAIVGLKKGYVIASLVSIGVTISALVNASINKTSASAVMNIAGGFMASLGSNASYNYTVEDGPAYILLILAAVVMLLTMIWNAIGNDE